jgi:hypothetical protein
MRKGGGLGCDWSIHNRPSPLSPERPWSLSAGSRIEAASPALRGPLAALTVAFVGLQVPPNGLVLYTGTIMTDDGKEKKLNIDFEPFKPINTSLYLCDNKFHTEALNELLESDSKWVASPRRPFPCLACTVAARGRRARCSCLAAWRRPLRS